MIYFYGFLLWEAFFLYIISTKYTLHRGIFPRDTPSQSFFLFIFVWLRASFPRYRYDQLMTLGWKVLIPITIVWIGVECVMFTLEIGPWSVT